MARSNAPSFCQWQTHVSTLARRGSDWLSGSQHSDGGSVQEAPRQPQAFLEDGWETEQIGKVVEDHRSRTSTATEERLAASRSIAGALGSIVSARVSGRNRNFPDRARSWLWNSRASEPTASHVPSAPTEGREVSAVSLLSGNRVQISPNLTKSMGFLSRRRCR